MHIWWYASSNRVARDLGRLWQAGHWGVCWRKLLVNTPGDGKNMEHLRILGGMIEWSTNRVFLWFSMYVVFDCPILSFPGFVDSQTLILKLSTRMAFDLLTPQTRHGTPNFDTIFMSNVSIVACGIRQVPSSQGLAAQKTVSPGLVCRRGFSSPSLREIFGGSAERLSEGQALVFSCEA